MIKHTIGSIAMLTWGSCLRTNTTSSTKEKPQSLRNWTNCNLSSQIYHNRKLSVYCKEVDWKRKYTYFCKLKLWSFEILVPHVWAMERDSHRFSTRHQCMQNSCCKTCSNKSFIIPLDTRLTGSFSGLFWKSVFMELHELNWHMTER